MKVIPQNDVFLPQDSQNDRFFTTGQIKFPSSTCVFHNFYEILFWRQSI